MLFPKKINQLTYLEIYNKRKELLLEGKRLANYLISQNKNYPLEKGSWKNKTIEQNISNLKSLVVDINYELKDSNLKIQSKLLHEIENLPKYTDENRHEYFNRYSQMSIINAFNLNFILSRLTVLSTLEYDINWLKSIPGNILNEISFGQKSPQLFCNYIPSTIKRIEEEIPKNSNLNKFEIELVNSAIRLSKSKSYLSSNILIITLLESLTHKLLSFSFTIQNPQLTDAEIAQKLAGPFRSIYHMIENLELQPDIKVSYSQAAVYFYDSCDPTLITMRNKMKRHQTFVKTYKEYEQFFSRTDFNNLNENETLKIYQKVQNLTKKLNTSISNSEINSIDDFELITIKPKIEFITKKLQVDRNLIIHGQFTEIEHDWKNYIYLCALIELNSIFTKYKEGIKSKGNP